MTNPVWTALVETKLSAWQANEKMDGPDSMNAGPCWCFSRFGQSKTELPDGRVVFIAGEHEDSYDDDFFIYNDVVIRHPSGRIEILGYPEHLFPPTDFHSATLADDRIVLIGSLGYPDRRAADSTQVALLDLADFSVRLVYPTGDNPGRLHDHRAELSDDKGSIAIKGGKNDPGPTFRALIENIDEWQLHLDEWRWERLTNRKWLRWMFQRADGKRNRLFEIRHRISFEKLSIPGEARGLLEGLAKDYEGEPKAELVEGLYAPSCEHATMPQVPEEYAVYRIKVNGTVIRFVEEGHAVTMTVEGVLDPTVGSGIAIELQSKLSALEGTPYELRPLET